MVNENKSNVFAAVAGAVVGAGAVIAGVVAMKDKNNQKIVKETIAVGKDKAKKLIKVAKTAEKGVKNL